MAGQVGRLEKLELLENLETLVGQERVGRLRKPKLLELLEKVDEQRNCLSRSDGAKIWHQTCSKHWNRN